MDDTNLTNELKPNETILIAACMVLADMSDGVTAGDVARTITNSFKRNNVVVFNWQKGFPTERGMYLVELEDGEHCVTPWHDGTETDTWGDSRGHGWTCLTESRSRVMRWVKAKELK